MLDSIHEVVALSAAWCVGHVISPTAGLRVKRVGVYIVGAMLCSLPVAKWLIPMVWRPENSILIHCYPLCVPYT